MYIRDEKQRELIINIKKSDKKAWDEFILMYYEQINKILDDLKIPIDLHEDILHDCIVTVIEYIDNFDVEKYEYIYARFRVLIIKQITNSLSKYFDYKKVINGKVYSKPRAYLLDVNNNCTYYDVINEYLNYGKRKEDVIENIPLMDREIEDIVIDNSLKEVYWNYVFNEPEKKQGIIMGHFPIDDCYEESNSELARLIGCTRPYVQYEIRQIRSKMARYSKFVQYLKR